MTTEDDECSQHRPLLGWGVAGEGVLMSRMAAVG